ncbi:MAG: hypothetical protein WCA31_12910 [Acidimicrobiales bacterium]
MPTKHLENTTCASCKAGLRHCHGTAIVLDEAHACSDDPDCVLDVDEHWFVVVDGEA